MSDIRKYLKLQYKLLMSTYAVGLISIMYAVVPYLVIVAVNISIATGSENIGSRDFKVFNLLNNLFFVLSIIDIILILILTNRLFKNAAMFFNITRKKYFISMMIYVFILTGIFTLLQSSLFAIAVVGNKGLVQINYNSLVTVIKFSFVNFILLYTISILFNLLLLLMCKHGTTMLIIIIFAMLVAVVSAIFIAKNLIVSILIVGLASVNLIIVSIILGIFGIVLFLNWLLIKNLDIAL